MGLKECLERGPVRTEISTDIMQDSCCCCSFLPLRVHTWKSRPQKFCTGTLMLWYVVGLPRDLTIGRVTYRAPVVGAQRQQ